jgi:hypothetical protein
MMEARKLDSFGYPNFTVNANGDVWKGGVLQSRIHQIVKAA